MEFQIQLHKSMEFQMFILAAPIEDNMIFSQKSVEFQTHFDTVVWKFEEPWGVPTEDKIFLAKKLQYGLPNSLL